MAGSSPCASCKLLRRRCTKDCVFAPYFPSDDPHKFAIVHKIFGASNVSKMLQELPIHQREDAVSSMVYEANARVRDPVYGCVGAISALQNQVAQLQMQLAMAQAEMLYGFQMQHEPIPTPDMDHNHHHQHKHLEMDGGDEKSFFMHDNIINPPSHHHHHHRRHHQYLNFASSNDNVINGSIKRECLFGHDMVS